MGLEIGGNVSRDGFGYSYLKRKYPIGIQTFKKLREGKCFYLDKTRMIGRLVSTPGSYLLCRPARFGKSLLLSTISAYFQDSSSGLFKGTAIDDLRRIDGRQRAVFHFDFGSRCYGSVSDLTNVVEGMLSGYERAYFGKPVRGSREDRLIDVIRFASAHTGRRVVVLVDDYDKPLTIPDENNGMREKCCEILRGFYMALKSADADVELMLIVGRSREGLERVMGDLHVNDVSEDPEMDRVCGVTRSELHRSMRSSVERLSRRHGLSPEETEERLLRLYGGFRFSDTGQEVMEPYSLFNALSHEKFEDYGLHRQAEKSGKTESKEEMKESLRGELRRSLVVGKWLKTLNLGLADEFMREMQKFFAGIPYDAIYLDNIERHYNNVLYLVLRLLGVEVHTEYRTSNGRIDLLIATEKYLYVIECKMNSTAKKALEQIESKDYDLGLETKGREVVRIGVNFSSATRSIDSWLISRGERGGESGVKEG